MQEERRGDSRRLVKCGLVRVGSACFGSQFVEAGIPAAQDGALQPNYTPVVLDADPGTISEVFGVISAMRCRSGRDRPVRAFACLHG